MDYDESVYATLASWKCEFQGDAVHVLLDTISDYLDKARAVYGRFAPLVNSSGTGKSRMVDELSKEIISVPICLRVYGSGGFPPPDGNLRNWLLTGAGYLHQDGFAQRMHAFVYTLLCVTLEYLKSIDERGDIPKHGEERQRALASAFRDIMTRGHSFHKPGPDRIKFYDEVIKKANVFVQDAQGPSPPEYVAGGKGIYEAAEALCNFVDPSGVLDAKTGPRRPLIIIYLDEYHKLADEQFLFSELLRVLGRLVKLPIFVLFLSTAGQFYEWRGAWASLDLSSVDTLPPISEISFDDIMLPSTEGATLDQVVQEAWMSHIGRPLFGTRFDAAPGFIKKSDALIFAGYKLIAGQISLDNTNNDRRGGILACLLVRFGLEFNTNKAEYGNIARRQVERHMRLCVAATSGFRDLVTISGSEPLLAEAAYQLMKRLPEDPVYYLASHSDLNCIDLGRHGELIAALLIMQARDKTTSGMGKSWITVSEFMDSLFPTAVHDKLQQSLPTIWRDGENQTFRETFKNYGMWFNHIIKVEDGEMISVNHLWKFIQRGAMIVCKNHYSIDIVLPACDVNQDLSPDSVTAILIQVKNDKKTGDKIQSRLFNAMDPFSLSLFDNERPPRPIIRVVFALASPTSAVLIPDPPTHQNRFKHFTAFDIWCAGLSQDTFKHVGQIQNLMSYKILLDLVPKPFDPFEINEPFAGGGETKAKRECQRRRMAGLLTSPEETNTKETKETNTKETKETNTEETKETNTEETNIKETNIKETDTKPKQKRRKVED